MIVSAIPSLVPFAAFLGGDEDALILVLVLAGIPGALSALRFVGMRADGSISAYRLAAALPADDYRPGRRLFGDLVWAAVVWLVGTGIIVVVALAAGEDDGTVIAAPLFVGLLWTMGLAVGTAIGLLIFWPLSILLDAIGARRRGRPFHRGWVIAAAILPLLLVWGVASFFAAAGVSEATGTPAKRRGLILEILFVDVSSLDPGVQIAAWIARASMLLVVGLVVFAAIDGRKDRRQDRDALRGASADGGRGPRFDPR